MVSYTDLDNLFNSDEDELTVSDVQKQWQLLDKKLQGTSMSLGGFGLVWGIFLAFVGAVAKHAFKQVPWLLDSRRTVLVDSYNHIFESNKLLYPYYPDSVCFLNIPLVIILQIQHWY